MSVEHKSFERGIPILMSKGKWLNQVKVWWARVQRLGQRAPKRLRLCESLGLGERRFVAVVEFDRARFLVGGTSSSLSLLARLDDRTAEEAKGEIKRAGDGAP